MKSKRTTTEEQVNYIFEYRQSDLTVYQWCQKKGITPTAYYNWVGKLRKKGISLPDVAESSLASSPTLNEVVQVDLLRQLPDVYSSEQQNAHK